MKIKNEKNKLLVVSATTIDREKFSTRPNLSTIGSIYGILEYIIVVSWFQRTVWFCDHEVEIIDSMRTEIPIPKCPTIYLNFVKLVENKRRVRWCNITSLRIYLKNHISLFINSKVSVNIIPFSNIDRYACYLSSVYKHLKSLFLIASRFG